MIGVTFRVRAGQAPKQSDLRSASIRVVTWSSPSRRGQWRANRRAVRSSI
jgi:hypothetical protein